MTWTRTAKDVGKFIWNNQGKIKSALGTAASAYQYAKGTSTGTKRPYRGSGGRATKRRRAPKLRYRKKRRGGALIRQSNNHQSFSSTVVKYKKQPVDRTYKVVSNLSQYTTTSSGYFGTVTGQTLARQYSRTLAHFFNGSDYGALVNTYFQNLESTDPYYGLVPTATNLNMKTLLQSCRVKFSIINQMETICQAKLYIVMAKTTGT